MSEDKLSGHYGRQPAEQGQGVRKCLKECILVIKDKVSNYRQDA